MSTSRNYKKKKTSTSGPKPQKNKIQDEFKNQNTKTRQIQVLELDSQTELEARIIAMIDKQFLKAESALEEILIQYDGVIRKSFYFEQLENFDEVVNQGEQLICKLQYNLEVFKQLEDEMRRAAMNKLQDCGYLKGEIMQHLSQINETQNMCMKMDQELKQSIGQHSDFRIKIRDTLKNDWKQKQLQIKNTLSEMKNARKKK